MAIARESVSAMPATAASRCPGAKAVHINGMGTREQPSQSIFHLLTAGYNSSYFTPSFEVWMLARIAYECAERINDKFSGPAPEVVIEA